MKTGLKVAVYFKRLFTVSSTTASSLRGCGLIKTCEKVLNDNQLHFGLRLTGQHVHQEHCLCIPDNKGHHFAWQAEVKEGQKEEAQFR